MKKRILHLTLKKEPFDQIAHGIKKEEYRDFKRYWRVRLYNKWLFVRTFDEVHFKNGYKKDSPFMKVECKGITQRRIEGKDKFVIKLGKVLGFKNYEYYV